MGRPLMEPLIWNATSDKPFGRSRLKKAIRALIDDYVRIVANATVALEFDTTPQFLSTLSLWRATGAIGRRGTGGRDISIHALLAESD